MRVKNLEELKIFQQSLQAADAVSALTNEPSFLTDPPLRYQLRTASAAVPGNIAEGFGQKTDRHFAHYLHIARGSCNEVRAHLAVARGRHQVSDEACRTLSERYAAIGRQITSLIKYLREENRLDRG